MAAANIPVQLPNDYQGDDRVLAFAHIHKHEKIEAPLYGVWGPCLEKHLCAPAEAEDILLGTYPQYTVDLEYDLEDVNIHSLAWRAAGTGNYPETPTRTRSRAPSPSSVGSGILKLLKTPHSQQSQSTPQSQRSQPTSQSHSQQSESHAAESAIADALTQLSSPETPNKRPARSSVVPDFIQKLYFIKRNDNDIPECDRVGIIVLIIEIKRHMLPGEIEYWKPRISSQTFKQACHAFHTSETTQVLGVIHVFGYKWRYFEYHRGEAFEPIDADEHADPSYNPPVSSGRATTANSTTTEESDVFMDAGAYNPYAHQQIPDFIKPFFEGKEYLDLIEDYEVTKAALAAIGMELYYDIESRICEPDDTDSESDEDDEGEGGDEGDNANNNGDDNKGENEGNEDGKGEGDRHSDALSYLDEEEGVHED